MVCVQLAIFLQSDTDKLGAQFCKALVSGHTDLVRAWHLLQPEDDHTVSVVLRAHECVNSDAPLLTKLQQLPPFLHEHAYRADYARRHPAPPLESPATTISRHVNLLGAPAGSNATRERLSAALAATRSVPERQRAA